MNATHKFRYWIGWAIWVACASTAYGNALNIPMTVEFSGATAPSAPPPWVRVYLDDSTQNGTLKLWIEALGLTDEEFLASVYLNFDPSYDVTQLKFTVDEKVGTFDLTQISLGQNLFKADGDGYYDILLEFSSAGPNRLGPGEHLGYILSMQGTPLPLLAFLQMSAPGGQHGPFMAAGHIQGIAPDGENSGWISHPGTSVPQIIPEPATLTLLGLAGAALISHRKRAR